MTKQHEKATLAFMKLMEDENLASLMQQALDQAKQQNPDKTTNPCNTLDELYDYLDYAVKCMPWNGLPDKRYETLYININQSINYFWFLFGQKLEGLKKYGYYLPTLEYHQPIAEWIADFSDAWGEFLNTPQSWNDDYYRLQFEDKIFGMNEGWYGEKNIWNNYNDFFSRKLIDPSVRPIGEAQLVSPADSEPDGYYHIDEEGFIKDDVKIKDHQVYNINDILGDNSAYKGRFNGGTLTHTFLNVFDYHRYHFPISGTIVEMNKIKGVNAVGGHTSYNPETKHYELDCGDTSWQIIETRDSVVLETEYGLVAVLPIGMSQICSCNFEPGLKVGSKVKKGDPMGYFLFGGSDIVMLFEKDIEFTMLAKAHQHLLMGENYATLRKNKPSID